MCLGRDFSVQVVPFALLVVPSPVDPAGKSGLRLQSLLILTSLQPVLLLRKGPVTLFCPELTFLLTAGILPALGKWSH